MKGLVVDPSATTTRILSRALRQVGCDDVAVASHLSDARALLAQSGANLAVVIIERDLSDGSGLDLVREIGSREAPAAAPGPAIIVVSSRHARGDVEQAIAAGANGYILKPFTMETLLERIAPALSARVKKAA